MSETHRDEIDGVAVFWGTAPPPLEAALTFRVGHADEPVPRRGITHAVEHLALSGLGQQRYIYNGAVGLLLTDFVAKGTNSEVASFLNATARGLAQLPRDRLAIESTILRTEAARRRMGALDHLLVLRYGVQSYGLSALPEFFLHDANADAVEEWRAKWFTAQNATLFLSGPPPAGIDLSPLAAGSRRPPPASTPLDQPLPGWYPTAGGNLVIASMLSDRGPAAPLAGEIVTRRLRSRLREADGLSYEVSGTYMALGPGHAHSSVQADALVEHIDTVRDTMITELSRFRMLGPTQHELDELRDEHRSKHDESPRRAAGDARHLAVEFLLLGETDMDTVEAEVEAVSVDDLRGSLDDALESAIWLVPISAGMTDRRISCIASHSLDGVDGTEHAPAPGVTGAEASHRLIVGADGVTLWIAPERPITVRYADCPAVQVWDDGARIMWGTDALRIFVHAKAWQDGAQAVESIDQHADPGVVVQMNESSSYVPPDDQGEPPPKRRFRRAR
jgi:zinc protease